MRQTIVTPIAVDTHQDLAMFLANQASSVDNTWHGQGGILRNAEFNVTLDDSAHYLEIKVLLKCDYIELTDEMLSSIARQVRRHFTALPTFRALFTGQTLETNLRVDFLGSRHTFPKQEES